MRPLLLIVFAAACTQSLEPAAPPAQPLTVEQVKVRPQEGPNVISGLVTKREGGAVLLDSGGPNPIPLVMPEGASVVVDDRPAAAAEIREGDLVRASYKVDEASGEPVALQVVVNSKSPAAPARAAKQ